MADWSWVLGGPPPSGTRDRELTKARGRTVTWRLLASSTAQFSINGRADEAAGIVALATDLTIFRDDEKLYRGRVGPENDTIDQNRHLCQFTFTDYRGMLFYRVTGDTGAAYDDEADGAIALDLVTTSQARAGGDWGVTAGVGTTTGTHREKTIDPGKPVDQSIGELANLDGGFEWEIDADLALNLWHPQRGADNGVVLDFRGLVSKIARQLDPKKFANAGVVSGSQGLTPVAFETADVGTDPRGRWETSAGYPTITEQSTLDARGPWLRDQTSTLRPTYSVTLKRDAWGGRAHIWLGDTVTLAIDSGRLQVNDPFRVIELSAQPGDSGSETITLGLLEAS